MTVPREQQPPRSVRFADGLLRVQAGCWGLLTAFFLIGLVNAAVEGSMADAAVLFAAGAVAAAFGILKGLLAGHLQPGAARTRRAVIGAELAMACFGAGVLLLTVVLAPSPAGFLLFLPFSTGTGLSIAAAIGLLRPPARRYTASPASTFSSHEEPADAESTRPAPFWRLQPASVSAPQS